MHTLDTIRTFKTKNFTVLVTAEDDSDIDLSLDDDGSVREGLESGKYVHFCVKAAVYYRGNEIATDYLGGCIYETPRAFMDHVGINHHVPFPGGPEGSCGSYFSDMVRTVCREARKAIADMKSIRVRSTETAAA